MRKSRPGQVIGGNPHVTCRVLCHAHELPRHDAAQLSVWEQAAEAAMLRREAISALSLKRGLGATCAPRYACALEEPRLGKSLVLCLTQTYNTVLLSPLALTSSSGLGHRPQDRVRQGTETQLLLGRLRQGRLIKNHIPFQQSRDEVAVCRNDGEFSLQL